jgi:hypothetical protein
MIYAQYTLTDLGYRAPLAGIDPLPEIWGLSNRDEEVFEHKGYQGYPDSHVWMAEHEGRVLAAFDGELDAGGTPVPAEDVPALLIADYGWPAGTTLGADGLPVAAE